MARSAHRSLRPVVAALCVGALAMSLGGGAQAHFGSMPILLRVGVIRPHPTKPARHLDLSLPSRPNRADPLAANARDDTGIDDLGHFVGPVFINGEDAADLHRALHAIPPGLRRSLATPIGPWGMTAQTVGNSWSAGMAMYARF